MKNSIYRFLIGAFLCSMPPITVDGQAQNEPDRKPASRSYGTVMELSSERESPVVLENYSLLAKAGDKELNAALFSSANRYVKAMALRELSKRGKKDQVAEVQQIFRTTIIRDAIRHSGHDVPPTPENSLLVASALYLLRSQGAAFLPEFLQRSEVWNDPLPFVEIFEEMPAGWIRQSSKLLTIPDHRSSLAFQIKACASADTIDELIEVLRQDQGVLWQGAVGSLQRINSAQLWEEAEKADRLRGPKEQLCLAIASYDAGRKGIEELAAAGISAAEAIVADRNPESRFSLINQVWLLLNRWRGMKIRMPDNLVTAIRVTELPELISMVDAIQQKTR